MPQRTGKSPIRQQDGGFDTPQFILLTDELPISSC